LEGIGWVFVSWRLEYLPKMWDLRRLSFQHGPQRKNQPAASHQAHQSPSQPSKIMHWMWQNQWWWFGRDWLGLCQLATWTLAQNEWSPKMRDMDTEFSTAISAKTSLILIFFCHYNNLECGDYWFKRHSVLGVCYNLPLAVVADEPI
jgi:hypothetical protein